ncbi:hypothetical protein HYX08_05900 [Candidatus Woesearchaeota archaeon]|nr:hypothetical protein [Candidatus Woesearchaeota archaeon]
MRKQMNRKIILFLILTVFLINIGNSFAKSNEYYTCEYFNSGLCIEVWFNTSISNLTDKPSEYGKFPYYTQQGDYLYIEKFIAINHGEKINSSTTYTLDIWPLEYKGMDERLTKYGPYTNNYGKIDIEIPPLAKGDKFELDYLQNSVYIKKLNDQPIGKYSHWFIELYKEGEWFIDEDIAGEIGGYTSIFNGFRSRIFQVNPPLELETFSDVRKQVKYILPTFLVSVISLIVSIYSLRRR